MNSRIILGHDAWASLLKSESGRWHKNTSRFSEALAVVDHKPKFSLNADDSFFCIGSCFARNIEEHLIYCGRQVLSKRVICPVEEWSGRANGFVNKFTTHSILNEIEWVNEPPVIDNRLFEQSNSGWLDLQLSPGVRPVTLERAIARRHYLSSEYFARLRNSSVVIVTLGLNEAWHDGETGRYLNAAPTLYSVKREPARYRLEITDVESNVAALEAIHDGITRLHPSARIIVTVSPVPMADTFSGRDVAVANTLSKATLRVAAEAFANNHSTVDYFPTLDMVLLSPRALAFGADCLHVSDKIVGIIMKKFLELYLDQSVVATPFNELAYLAANPDVDRAVRQGHWGSGFEHWISFGKQEGRRLFPEGGPSKLMIDAGAV